MKRSAAPPVVLGLWFALAVSVLVGASPSGAELEASQRAPWGLQRPGSSRTVANFSTLGWAVTGVGDAMFVGGNYLEVTNGDRTEPRPYLAAFSATTGAWVSTFAPEAGGPVLALEAGDDGALFVGGEMGSWNGQEIGALAKIDPATGELWPGWSTRLYGGTSVVRDLSLAEDGWLYAVGTFTTGSDAGTPRPVASVVRIDPVTGAIDWSWLPDLGSGGVWGISASQTTDTVYVAGWFDVNGAAAVGLDRADPATVVWDGFEMNFPCCGHMYDVEATEHGTVFVVGEQHGAYVYDEHDDMALIVSHATNYDSRHQDNDARRGGDYQRIERIGDRVYATCHCWGSHSSRPGPEPLTYTYDLAAAGGVNTGQVSGIVAYDPRTGERDRSFDPLLSGDVGGWGVAGAGDGCLWITGGFNAVGPPGQRRPGRDLVRLCHGGHDPGAGILAPPSCAATVDRDSVSVSWEPGTVVAGRTDPVADHVIHRSVDGGPPAWRGRTAVVPFNDTNRDGQLTYFVSARTAAGFTSEPTECTTSVVPPQPQTPPAPATCRATVAGGQITVDWSPLEGVDGPVEYVVRRSVDGAGPFWRGRVVEAPFVDDARDGVLVYSVSTRTPDRRQSPATSCDTVTEPPDVVEPIAACGVDVVAGAATVTVSWEPIEAGVEYVVRRSVDGSDEFWRGRVTGSAFEDSLRPGSITYSVEVKRGSERSAPVTCAPTIDQP